MVTMDFQCLSLRLGQSTEDGTDRALDFDFGVAVQRQEQPATPKETPRLKIAVVDILLDAPLRRVGIDTTSDLAAKAKKIGLDTLNLPKSADYLQRPDSSVRSASEQGSSPFFGLLSAGTDC